MTDNIFEQFISKETLKNVREELQVNNLNRSNLDHILTSLRFFRNHISYAMTKMSRLN
jgi:hypothetical protein